MRLVELTAIDRVAARAAFAAGANEDERRHAYRIGAHAAELYIHAHGALRLVAPARHRSLSYAAGRAWAALSDDPVGLDVVSMGDERPLDARFVTAAECAALAGLEFPAALAGWAAKEAAAKLTGDTRREPEGWRLALVAGRLRAFAPPHPPIALDPLQPERGLLAMLAVHG